MAYPDELPSLPTTNANNDPAENTHPDLHNDVNREVNAIGAELGLHPSGDASTVAERLAAIEAAPGGGSVWTSIMDHGAEGDGVADDTDALTDAIAATPAGGVLHLPAGTYKVDCSDSFELAADVRIVGDGRDATLLVCSNAAPTAQLEMFAPADGTHVALADLTIEGPTSIGAAGRFDAVYVDGSSGSVRADRCRFERFTSALRVSSSTLWQGAIEAEDCAFVGYAGSGVHKSTPILLNSSSTGSRGRRLRVRNCDFSDFGDSSTNLDHGIYAASDWDIDVADCRFLTSVGTGYGVQIYDTSVSAANRGLHQSVRNCRFASALTVSGIVAGGMSTPLVEGNVFENTTVCVNCNGGAPVVRGNRFLGIIASGSHVDTNDTPAPALPIVIEDNDFLAKSTKIIGVNESGDYVVRGNRFAPGAGTSYFISVEGSTPTVRVVDNDFRGTANSGVMRINVAGSLHVQGNTFLTTNGTCVELNHASAVAMVLGNNFSQAAGTSVVKTAVSATYRCVGNYGSNVGQVNVASAATVTFPEVGDSFAITGTTAITTLTASWPGRVVFLKFTSSVTLTDGNNILLGAGGSLAATSNDVIALLCDGTNWMEIAARSVN